MKCTFPGQWKSEKGAETTVEDFQNLVPNSFSAFYVRRVELRRVDIIKSTPIGRPTVVSPRSLACS